MSAFDPVLAAVDFSDDARRAAHRAAIVAAQQATLLVVGARGIRHRG